MINQPIKDIGAALVAAQIRVTNATPTQIMAGTRLSQRGEKEPVYLILVAYEFQWKNPILARYEWAKLVIWGTDLQEILEAIYQRVKCYREELEDPADPGNYLYRWAGEE